MLFNVAVADLERCDNRQNTEEEWRYLGMEFEEGWLEEVVKYDDLEKGRSLVMNLNDKKESQSKETVTEASFTSISSRKPKKSKSRISPPQSYDFVPLSRMFEKTDYRPRAFGSNERESSNRDKRQ